MLVQAMKRPPVEIWPLVQKVLDHSLHIGLHCSSIVSNTFLHGIIVAEGRVLLYCSGLWVLSLSHHEHAQAKKKMWCRYQAKQHPGPAGLDTPVKLVGLHRHKEGICLRRVRDAGEKQPSHPHFERHSGKHLNENYTATANRARVPLYTCEASYTRLVLLESLVTKYSSTFTEEAVKNMVMYAAQTQI